MSNIDQDLFSYFRYQATKTDLILNKKDGKPAWRETDLDHVTIKNYQDNNNNHENNHQNKNDDWNQHKSTENRNITSVKYESSNEISK